MTAVHPTAIVDKSAKLGENITIGAYSIVEAEVTIGDGTWIGPHVVIRNFTTIGKDNRIFQFCSIGEAPQHQGYAGEPTKLVIGERNTIREYCTINRATANGPDHLATTKIGNDNFIMAYAHIAHDCVLGDHIIFANGASLAGHVDIGDYAILGGFSLVHQFCKIGQHCITGIGCVCLQDVPPYIVAAGNPGKPFGINSKGLRRRNFSEQSIKRLNQAYRVVYRRRLNLQSAINEVEKMNGNHAEVITFSAFLRHSKRGIIR
ncbi:acyl-ACP--UDP-N-acetylglucosamine O-acyltransferase [Candidatus Spongiihabitans sp.]|uniref:acyl-ACP--UDP-N-acetylglucosamine O-acyltransferase n=1 Tax=Candidatus Spongiihabitans sp. TaxID=3101308 RepID=UPI003C7CA379